MPVQRRNESPPLNVFALCSFGKSSLDMFYSPCYDSHKGVIMVCPQNSYEEDICLHAPQKEQISQFQVAIPK